MAVNASPSPPPVSASSTLSPQPTPANTAAATLRDLQKRGVPRVLLRDRLFEFTDFSISSRLESLAQGELGQVSLEQKSLLRPARISIFADHRVDAPQLGLQVPAQVATGEPAVQVQLRVVAQQRQLGVVHLAAGAGVVGVGERQPALDGAGGGFGVPELVVEPGQVMVGLRQLQPVLVRLALAQTLFEQLDPQRGGLAGAVHVPESTLGARAQAGDERAVLR